MIFNISHINSVSHFKTKGRKQNLLSTFLIINYLLMYLLRACIILIIVNSITPNTNLKINANTPI